MTITHTSLETDLRLAVTLDTALHVLLHDAASIRDSGSLMYLGSVNGTGSDTSRIRYAGLNGLDAMAVVADGSAASETALTDASVDIAVTRKCILRQITDLATLTGFANDINPATLAASVVGEYNTAFNDAVAAAVASAATTVGSSGVDMTVDDYYDAMFQLELNSVPGPYFAMLHPRQIADFQESLRAEGGATQYMQATADMLRIKGQGYAGNFLGVDIYKMSAVDDDGSDREGGMWGFGAIGWKNGIIQTPPGAVMTSPDREVVVEFARGPGAASGFTQIIGHAYFGVSVLEQDRIVGINTDN